MYVAFTIAFIVLVTRLIIIFKHTSRVLLLRKLSVQCALLQTRSSPGIQQCYYVKQHIHATKIFYAVVFGSILHDK